MKTLVKINELFSALAAESLLAFFFGILFRFFISSFPNLIIRNVWYLAFGICEKNRYVYLRII